MHDLTAFQRDLLFVTSGLNDELDESPHGLAIVERMSDYYESKIHHGRLYPNLDTLVDKGLLSKHEKDKRTNGYTLSKRGRRELAERMEWQRGLFDGA